MPFIRQALVYLCEKKKRKKKGCTQLLVPYLDHSRFPNSDERIPPPNQVLIRHREYELKIFIVSKAPETKHIMPANYERLKITTRLRGSLNFWLGLFSMGFNYATTSSYLVHEWDRNISILRRSKSSL